MANFVCVCVSNRMIKSTSMYSCVKAYVLVRLSVCVCLHARWRVIWRELCLDSMPSIAIMSVCFVESNIMVQHRKIEYLWMCVCVCSLNVSSFPLAKDTKSIHLSICAHIIKKGE